MERAGSLHTRNGGRRLCLNSALLQRGFRALAGEGLCWQIPGTFPPRTRLGKASLRSSHSCLLQQTGPSAFSPWEAQPRESSRGLPG